MTWRRACQAARRWWHRGHWSFAASQITWVQSQGYIYICTAMLGLEALAALAASRLLIAPILPGINAWVRFFQPRLAETFGRQEATHGIRLLWISTGLLVTGCVAWGTTMTAAGDFLARTVLAEKFSTVHVLLALWTLAFACQAFRTVWWTALRAFGDFVLVTRVSVAGAVVSALMVPVGIRAFGEAGALLGLAASEALMGFVACRKVLRQATDVRISH